MSDSKNRRRAFTTGEQSTHPAGQELRIEN
jgi:hypothetical protein